LGATFDGVFIIFLRVAQIIYWVLRDYTAGVVKTWGCFLLHPETIFENGFKNADDIIYIDSALLI